MSIDTAALTALTERAGFTDRSDCGRLWITGADALDLLNRLTTNNLETLPVDTVRSTVLTNGDARVLDHLRLAAIDEGVRNGIWCFTSPGRAEAVAEWIDLYTFGEDITVQDWSAATTHFTVAGPLAADALTELGHVLPGVDEVVTATAILIASPFGAHTAYDLLLHTWVFSTQERQREYLELQKDSLRLVAQEVDAETFEAYRIAQGVPAYGAEFGAFNNPLEARLLGSISEDKGCYTGQEVIARLQTYRKVQRLLMSFEAGAPAAPGDALETEDGSPAGVVTSAFDTGDGRTLGLALVAAKHLTAGSSLRIAGGGAVALSDPAHALATEPLEA